MNFSFQKWDVPSESYREICKSSDTCSGTERRLNYGSCALQHINGLDNSLDKRLYASLP